MKKDDLATLLNQSKGMIEDNEFLHSQITRLWVQANCLKQTIEDIIRKNKLKTSDNDKSN